MKPQKQVRGEAGPPTNMTLGSYEICLHCSKKSLLVERDELTTHKACFRLPSFCHGPKETNERPQVSCTQCGFQTDLDSYLTFRLTRFDSSWSTSETDDASITSATTGTALDSNQCDPILETNEAYVSLDEPSATNDSDRQPRWTYLYRDDTHARFESPQEPQCPNCRYGVRTSWRFCPRCGVYMD